MESTLMLRLAVWSIPSIIIFCKKLNQEHYLKCPFIYASDFSFHAQCSRFVCEQITPPAGSFVYLQPKDKLAKKTVCQKTWKDNKRHN